MRIDYIQMKNFRQYANVRIEFAGSPTKNFTVIQGPNGAGKTNLMNAITWCLFGDELHVSKYKGLPIANTTALDEAKDGELIEVRVEIQFVNNGKRIIIAREIDFKKQKGNLVEVPSPHPSPSIMRQTERDWFGPIFGSDAQYQIGNMIPQSIEEYFFFDGERMNDYFKQNTGRDIRKAVFKISQMELLEKLIEHLSARRTEFLRMTRGLSSEAQSIKEFIELQERSLKHDNEEYETMIAEEETAEGLAKEFSEKLQKSSLEHIQDLETQREELKTELNSIQIEIEDLDAEKLKLLHRKMPIIFTHEALLKTKGLIDKSRAAGKIPPRYEAIFIQNLLDKGKCICGTDISGKDEYSNKRRKKVEAFLDSEQLSEISTELIEANVRIGDMLEGLANFQDDVVGYGKKLKALQDRKSSKNEAVKKIDQEIEQSDVESIRKWEQERKKNADKAKDLIGKIAIVKDRIDRRNRIIRLKGKELTIELKKEKKHGSLVEIFEFCEKGIKCAQETKDTIMKQVKEEIEKKTSEQFLALIWKKDTFKCVQIDDDYNVSVPHVSGREALGTLSAGERQVCALSFMAALNSVSGFDVPIVIDTPLARISSEPRVSIAENLPRYLEGKQVTLLVTEEEYTSEVRDALSKKVDKMYQINVKEKERGNLAQVRLIND